MHECTSITINSFHLFQQRVWCEGGRVVLKERMKTNNKGRGGIKPISMLTVSQTANKVPSDKLFGSC